MMGEKVEAELQQKEDVMISPTLLVIMIKHRWVSPRGRLYAVGLVQRGLSGLHRAVPRRTNQPYCK